MQDTIERRRDPRRYSRVNKIVRASVLPASGEGFKVNLFIVDISVGGMRVNVDLRLPLEGEFQVSLPLEGFGDELERISGGVLEFNCRTVWHRELVGGTWVHGLQFLGLSSEAVTTVKAMVERFSEHSGRKRFRLTRLLPVALKIKDESGWIDLYASDLSPEGVGISLDRDLKTGSQVMVKIYPEFDLPVVQVQGVVEWTREVLSGNFKVGISFCDIGEMEAQVIGRYIKRCLELQI